MYFKISAFINICFKSQFIGLFEIECVKLNTKWNMFCNT